MIFQTDKSTITINNKGYDQLDFFNFRFHNGFYHTLIRPQTLLERFFKIKHINCHHIIGFKKINDPRNARHIIANRFGIFSSIQHLLGFFHAFLE